LFRHSLRSSTFAPTAFGGATGWAARSTPRLSAEIAPYWKSWLQHLFIPLLVLPLMTPAVSGAQTVDETSNGSTIQAVPGQVIELVLHSMYWRIDGSSDPAVVAQNAEPSRAPAPPGTCPPGVGCGVVQVAFTARQTGTARISASRTLCGEVLPCRPDQRSFMLTIVVH